MRRFLRWWFVEPLRDMGWRDRVFLTFVFAVQLVLTVSVPVIIVAAVLEVVGV